MQELQKSSKSSKPSKLKTQESQKYRTLYICIFQLEIYNSHIPHNCINISDIDNDIDSDVNDIEKSTKLLIDKCLNQQHGNYVLYLQVYSHIVLSKFVKIFNNVKIFTPKIKTLVSNNISLLDWLSIIHYYNFNIKKVIDNSYVNIILDYLNTYDNKIFVKICSDMFMESKKKLEDEKYTYDYDITVI